MKPPGAQRDSWSFRVLQKAHDQGQEPLCEPPNRRHPGALHAISRRGRGRWSGGHSPRRKRQSLTADRHATATNDSPEVVAIRRSGAAGNDARIGSENTAIGPIFWAPNRRSRIPMVGIKKSCCNRFRNTRAIPESQPPTMPPAQCPTHAAPPTRGESGQSPHRRQRNRVTGTRRRVHRRPATPSCAPHTSRRATHSTRRRTSGRNGKARRYFGHWHRAQSEPAR